MTTELNLDKWTTPNSMSVNFGFLPSAPGVYVLVLASWAAPPAITHTVLYVGMSANLARRFHNHEIKKLCDDQSGPNEYVQIYFRRCPKDKLRVRERNLIKRLNPPYNLQHRRRGF